LGIIGLRGYYVRITDKRAKDKNIFHHGDTE